jgi:hypothetical protein
MNKEIFHSDYGNEPEYVSSEKDLDKYLGGIAEEIGWIIICFNSLEDTIGGYLREMMLRDPCQDERLDVFLVEMGYASKARALIHLYGQAVRYGVAQLPEGEIVEMEKDFNLAATIRNGYAHADWFGLRDDDYIKVKTRSSKHGIIHRYKRIDLETAKADVGYIVSVRNRLNAVHELILDKIYDRIPADDAKSNALPPIKYPMFFGQKNLTGRAYDETREDVLNALLALGYSQEEALNALANLPIGVDLAEGIKSALANLKADKTVAEG